MLLASGPGFGRMYKRRSLQMRRRSRCMHNRPPVGLREQCARPPLHRASGRSPGRARLGERCPFLSSVSARSWRERGRCLRRGERKVARPRRAWWWHRSLSICLVFRTNYRYNSSTLSRSRASLYFDIRDGTADAERRATKKASAAAITKRTELMVKVAL